MKKIIDIVAPASHCTQEELMASIEWLKREGFTPRIGKDIIKPDLFFASNLKNQTAQMKKAISAKDSDFIWCLRGGYGSMRLIPELSKMAKPKKEKIFLGFSDVTSLHLFFTQKWKWKTYHGPNFSGIGKKDQLAQDVKEVVHLLNGEQYNPLFDGLIPMNKAAEKKSLIKGSITGGNLRVVQASLNTIQQIKPKGKILFFEDIGERGYAVHRMLEQLQQAGLFKGVQAMVLGDFNDGLEKDGKDRKMEALSRFASSVSFPVLSGLPCGHDKLNRILPFHQKCTLETGKNSKLVF
ncbi:MAG: LD-carboxypeptidase [Bacteriovoracaceae bacterium]